MAEFVDIGAGGCVRRSEVKAVYASGDFSGVTGSRHDAKAVVLLNDGTRLAATRDPAEIQADLNQQKSARSIQAS